MGPASSAVTCADDRGFLAFSWTRSGPGLSTPAMGSTSMQITIYLLTLPPHPSPCWKTEGLTYDWGTRVCTYTKHKNINCIENTLRWLNHRFVVQWHLDVNDVGWNSVDRVAALWHSWPGKLIFTAFSKRSLIVVCWRMMPWMSECACKYNNNVMRKMW